MKDKYRKENLLQVVKISKSFKDVCRKLNICTTGNNFYTVKKYIEIHNIDTAHFLTQKEHLNKIHEIKKPSNKEIFCENSPFNTYRVKKRIIKENLIKYQCAICSNNGEWNQIKLVLQLDHIDGISNNNVLSNLRFLCPNCHSQTDTFCGKHRGKKAILEKERAKNNGFTEKEKRSYINKRKVKDRPCKETLILEIKEMGYVKVGRKYNVSDNAIRKWVK